MDTLDEMLKQAVAMHGHLCSGQVLGVRMAMVGCREVGILEPEQSRASMVWVEIDRCAADVISAVTGCKLGKRTLKYADYGKMAATFLNMTSLLPLTFQLPTRAPRAVLHIGYPQAFTIDLSSGGSQRQ